MAFFILMLTQYIRFYSLVIDPSFLRNMLTETGWLTLFSERALIDGFRLATFAFVAFCFTVFFLLRWSPIDRSTEVKRTPSWVDVKFYERPAVVLLLLSPVLMLVLGYFASIYHIGQLGSSIKAELPFRLAGVIYYARLIFVPTLLMFLICAADRAGRQDMVRAGFLLLLAHGVMDVLIKSSRGALLLSVLSLIFLALVGGYKIRRMEKYAFSAVVALAAIAIPLTHQYRVLRNSGLEITAAISGLADSPWNLSTMILDAIQFIYFRLPGVEMPIAIMGVGGRPLGSRAFEVLSVPNGVADYLTHTVLGFPQEVTHSFAPSFIGWFYLIGGELGVITSGMILALFVTVFWGKLIGQRLYSGPVAQTLFLLILFNAMTEGTLDVLRYHMFAMIACIMCIEIVMSYYARARQ